MRIAVMGRLYRFEEGSKFHRFSVPLQVAQNQLTPGPGAGRSPDIDASAKVPFRPPGPQDYPICLRQCSAPGPRKEEVRANICMRLGAPTPSADPLRRWVSKKQDA